MATPHNIIDIHCRCKQFVQHGTTKQENKPLSKLLVAYKWYRVFIVCFPFTVNPFRDLTMEFLLLIWSITNVIFDVHEHLNEDTCNVTALLPPGDQTPKYNLGREQNMETKNRENIVSRKLNNRLGRPSKVGRSATRNKMFLWCLNWVL